MKLIISLSPLVVTYDLVLLYKGVRASQLFKHVPVCHNSRMQALYEICCKTHIFMSTVKQFELSGAFLSRSLMALSLDISFARFFYFHIYLFYFFLMAKILDICYARTSQQLQKLFSVTHLKKS